MQVVFQLCNLVLDIQIHTLWELIIWTVEQNPRPLNCIDSNTVYSDLIYISHEAAYYPLLQDAHLLSEEKIICVQIL